MDPYNTIDTLKRAADVIEFTDPWSAVRKVNDRRLQPCLPTPQPSFVKPSKKRS